MTAKTLRVLALVHTYLIPPDDVTGIDLEKVDWKTEYDVISALREMGHEVQPLGVGSDLGVIRRVVSDWKPHIAFNLLEAFDEVAVFDQNVVSYLEMLRLPYTGCNPRGLVLSRDKALSKQLLAYHRIPVPDFSVFHRGRRVRKPKRLDYPLIVKSLTEEASIGISQASVVDSDEKLQERVGFIHDSIATDAIAERYIEGRELYVGVLGNQQVQVLPVWELSFTKMPDDVHRIATERVKWSRKYQDKHGVKSGAAELPAPITERLQRLSRRVYRTLQMTGYGRIDLRLAADSAVYVLEANPNPHIAREEDFAASAERQGIPYGRLLQRIINLGLRWQPARGG